MASEIDELNRITPDDVAFIRELKNGEFSVLFLVAVRGTKCVMKVYPGHKPSHADSKVLEPDIFKCERDAYRRLKARGLCQQKVVPDFYGVIEQMDPTHWQPHLNRFLEDEMRPNAVLMEYIPGMKQMDLSTFSESRLSKLHSILLDMHRVGINHGDPYPRNMMVQEGSDRVLWIDFDRAATLSEHSPTKRQQSWIDFEVEWMDYFVVNLKKDYEEGKLSRVYNYYYQF